MCPDTSMWFLDGLMRVFAIAAALVAAVFVGGFLVLRRFERG